MHISSFITASLLILSGGVAAQRDYYNNGYGPAVARRRGIDYDEDYYVYRRANKPAAKPPAKAAGKPAPKANPKTKKIKGPGISWGVCQFHFGGLGARCTDSVGEDCGVPCTVAGARCVCPYN